jgi:hypothetical protein
MNGLADALVGPTTAYMLRHDFIHFCIRRVRVSLEQCGGFHNHARLAEPALRHIFYYPGLLAGMITMG